MTLALLITAVTGAWAADTYTITFSGFGYEACNKTVTDATLEYSETFNFTDVDAYFMTLSDLDGSNEYVSIGQIDDTQFTITVKSAFEGTVKVTVNYVNGDGDESQRDISVTCVKSEPAIEVTTNAASEQDLFTEASFTMPTSDVTIDYELVRDMTIAVSAEMPSRVRIQKDNNVFVAVTPSEMLPTVTDGIDEQNPATMTSATDYTLQLQKEGENNSWTDVTELSVGTFRYAVTGVGLYDGVMYTNTFELFQGYEIDVPAGEYVTYYKDENLYEEDSDVKLYTISSVSTTAATLSSEIAIAPANTPILVYNGGQEAKTVLLIPTVDAADNVQAATAFKGTLTETTIPASTSTQNNYAFNGKQFVWVKEALPVAANKCWLEIPNSANAAPAMTIVFGEATGIGVIDKGQRTSGDWYDLNGRKLEGRPTKKGVYINNGRKVVIK